ncbi:MAG: hypothetical protein M1820_009787 [Bogoriella megaspora]|nr:MAG: hypothetical protein M1820_009787 [Bogoriella megaspora]
MWCHTWGTNNGKTKASPEKWVVDGNKEFIRFKAAAFKDNIPKEPEDWNYSSVCSALNPTGYEFSGDSTPGKPVRRSRDKVSGIASWAERDRVPSPKPVEQVLTSASDPPKRRGRARPPKALTPPAPKVTEPWNTRGKKADTKKMRSPELVSSKKAFRKTKIHVKAQCYKHLSELEMGKDKMATVFETYPWIKHVAKIARK